MSGNINQFDVFVADLEPSKGSEIRKVRPIVIISPKEMNKNLKTVLIAPLTHTLKQYPSRVFCELNGETGEIVLDQIRGIDKKRLKRKIGAIDKRTAADLKKVLATMFS